MKQNRYVVAQLGARMHYAVPRMLQHADMLVHFYTDICAEKGFPRLLRAIPDKLRPTGLKRLLGRKFRDIPLRKVTAFTGFGWDYSRRLRAACTPVDVTETHLWAGETFSKLVLKAGFGNANGIYTFNSAGLEMLTAARERNILAVMEQTIAPKAIENRLIKHETEKFPDWNQSTPEENFVEKFIQRERSEWEVADVIVCGSEFVRESISNCGGPADRCVVVPYGVDAQMLPIERLMHTGPLRVLTIGAVGLRKGSPYVLEAAQQFRGRAEFRMVGTIGCSDVARKSLAEYVELIGPVPRSEIHQHFGWADVFLLPSICEGSATVVYEALAAGLPVICTPNTGSVIRDQLEGFIVPPSDYKVIIDRLTMLINHPDMLKKMSRNALKLAADYTVDKYSQRLNAALAN